MLTITLRLLLATLLLCLAACNPTSTPNNSASVATSSAIMMPPQETDDDLHGIDWFQGSVAEAFSLAASSGKPIFLYWGAVWCPPCQEIKHTVFKSSQFIAQSKLFIPVYLDGDTDRAQTLGEKFGVKGYPTMIVFSPQGEEVTRIPGGIDISRYNAILAASLDSLRSTRLLVQLALNTPNLLVSTDYRQLAYYSWGQDFEALPAGTDPILFNQLAKRILDQDPESSARLYLQYLVMLAKAQTENLVKVEPGQLLVILNSPALVIGTWDYLAYQAKEISSVLDLDDLALDNLKDRWQQVMLEQRHHAALSTAEQLGGWFPYLTFYFEDASTNTAVPADQLAAIRQDAETANRVTRNAYARQSVVNQVSYLLETAGLQDEARQLLLAELDRSAAPYYFMSSLGALAEAQGHIEEALAWRNKAYQVSEGRATRLQWGVSYVDSLIRLAPQQTETISQTALTLLDELSEGHIEDGGIDDTFAGRNFRALRRLHKNLLAWHATQIDGPLLENLNARLGYLCGRQPAGSTTAANCQSLLVAPNQDRS